MFSGSDSGQVRLKIESHGTIDCSDGVIHTFIAQTNPEEINYEFKIDNGSGEGDTGVAEMEAATGNSASPPIFRGYLTVDLNIKIKADATGIVPVPEGMEGKFGSDSAPSIKDYLDLLQNTVYSYQEASHGPPYLAITWGQIAPNANAKEEVKKTAVFKGQLESYKVDIKLFSVSGEPVKADIELNIKSLVAPDAKPLGQSPDLTHHIAINHGDKMTTHCNKIYGRYDSKICSAVAEYNGLIDWDLKPGTKMTFPSIHMLQELYLDKYEDVEIKHIHEETEFERMSDLIGEKKAKQYFKTFSKKGQFEA